MAELQKYVSEGTNLDTKLKGLDFLTEKESAYIYLVYNIMKENTEKVEEASSLLKETGIKQKELDKLTNILKGKDSSKSSVNDLIADIFNNKGCC